MAATKPKGLVDAVQTIHDALEPLEPEDRTRVLDSVMTLMDVSAPAGRAAAVAPQGGLPGVKAWAPPKPSRPLSLVELMQAKQPASNTQRLAVFAFYREKIEGLSRFARADLRNYFARAKLTPSTNYDRDFTSAVKLGWIHEDGDESYLTTKGLEAVEAGFEGKQMPRGKHSAKKRRKKKRTKKKPARKTASKKKTRKKTRKKRS